MNPKDLIGAKKAPLRYVPASLAIAAAPAMANGAEKYGPFNWREQPVEVVTYLEAALRHIYAYLDGEDIAEDSGVDHLAHAVATLAIVIDARAYGSAIDNRVAGPAPALLAQQDRTLGPPPPEDDLPWEWDDERKWYRMPTGGEPHLWSDDCGDMGCREVTDGKD